MPIHLEEHSKSGDATQEHLEEKASRACVQVGEHVVLPSSLWLAIGLAPQDLKPIDDQPIA